MSDDGIHDLTPSSPVAPLPAPTTTTTRALAPRRARGRAARSTSRSTTASTSTSRSSSDRRPPADSCPFRIAPHAPTLTSEPHVGTDTDVPLLEPPLEQPEMGVDRKDPSGPDSTPMHELEDLRPRSSTKSPGPFNAARSHYEDTNTSWSDTHPEKRPRKETHVSDALPPVPEASGSGRKRRRMDEFERVQQSPDDLEVVGRSRSIPSSNVDMEAMARKRPRIERDEGAASVETPDVMATLPTSSPSGAIDLNDRPSECLSLTTVSGASVNVDTLREARSLPTLEDGPISGPSSVDTADIIPSGTTGSTVQQLRQPIDVDSLPDMPILEDLTESPSPSRSSSARPHSYSRISLPSASSSQAAPATPPKDDSPTQTVEPLSAYTCPICFSPPTYATLTPCGHICCGECLFTAIKTTMERAAHSAVPLSERNTARCPVCRASIPGWNGKGGGVIGLKPRAVLTL